MGSLFYLIILQILCCSIAASEQPNPYLMSDKFINSSSSVIQSIWRKEPYLSCNIPKPPVNSLRDETFLTFNINRFLCVILYDASLRYSNLQVPDHFPQNQSDKLIQKIIDDTPKPNDFCQKMKGNAWYTDILENEKWLQLFNNLMKNETVCNRYCLSRTVNPVCAYVLWLDSSVKKLRLKTPEKDHAQTFQWFYSNMEQQQQNRHPRPLIGQSNPSGIQSLGIDPLAIHESTLSHTSNYFDVTSANKKDPNSANHQNPSTSGMDNINQMGISHQELHAAQKLKDSETVSNALFNAEKTLNVVSNNSGTSSNVRKHKPPVLDLGSRGHVESENKIPALDKDNDGQLKAAVVSVAPATSNSEGSKVTIADPKSPLDDGMPGDLQYSDNTQTQPETVEHSPVSAANEIDSHENGKLVVTTQMASAKDGAKSVTTESKLNQSPGETITKEKGEDQLVESKSLKSNSENAGNPVDDGTVSDGTLASEPGDHEEQRNLDEAMEPEPMPERPEEQSPEMDGVPSSVPRFGGESDDPLGKPNPSPVMPDYADELSDEDNPNPINPEQEKVTQNDAGAGIFVHDRFGDAEDSHFFAYFMTMIILCIIGYLIFHNKQKILALALEGRVRKGNRRRPSTSGYRKLDSNLEEAVTSNCSGATVTHVIY